MNILFVNIPSGKQNTDFEKFVREEYVPLLKENLNITKSTDTKITFRFCEWGMGPIDMAYYRYLDHLAQSMVYYSACNAEKEGYDAVIINCFGDPMLWELRQALNIPVVGLGESSMLYSIKMGYKFGIVTISPNNIPETNETIEKYGLSKKCVGCVSIPCWKLGEKATIEETINSFKTAAHSLIEKGAEVIIPGCSVMSPKIRLHELTNIDDCAIVDILSIAISEAETLAKLKKGNSAWISRKCLYNQPSEKIKTEAEYLLKNEVLKFWDVR